LDLGEVNYGLLICKSLYIQKEYDGYMEKYVQLRPEMTIRQNPLCAEETPITGPSALNIFRQATLGMKQEVDGSQSARKQATSPKNATTPQDKDLIK
jgi:hypothetical protein